MSTAEAQVGCGALYVEVYASNIIFGFEWFWMVLVHYMSYVPSTSPKFRALPKTGPFFLRFGHLQSIELLNQLHLSGAQGPWQMQQKVQHQIPTPRGIAARGPAAPQDFGGARLGRGLHHQAFLWELGATVTPKPLRKRHGTRPFRKMFRIMSYT